MDDGLTPSSSARGLVVGLVGGALDFASGTALFLGGAQEVMMGNTGMTRQNELLALGLFLLGAIVIMTAVVSVISLGKRHPKLLSGLMVAYGIVMLLVGGSMAGGLFSVMSTPLYGYAMIIVGILMIVNGSSMSRTEMRM
jgi:hypothetical protein